MFIPKLSTPAAKHHATGILTANYLQVRRVQWASGKCLSPNPVGDGQRQIRPVASTAQGLLAYRSCLNLEDTGMADEELTMVSMVM